MNESIVDWFLSVATASDFTDCTVIEIGSRWINGGLRPQIQACGPASYTGCDPVPGPGVDDVCDADGLLSALGAAAADVIIATEVLHAAEEWRSLFVACHALLRPGGIIFLTTRSPGAPMLDFPRDFWRFTADDVRAIFASWEILSFEEDDLYPGIMVKAIRTAAPIADLVPIEPWRMQKAKWRPTVRTSNTRS